MHSKFSATVRVLLGDILNVNLMSSPLVYAKIVSEDQTRAIVETNNLINVVDSGNLLNNDSPFIFTSSGPRVATFKNMVCKMTPLKL